MRVFRLIVRAGTDRGPFRKYRYMDGNLNQRRRGLEEKIPDIKKTLSMVEYLRDRRVSLQDQALSSSLKFMTGTGRQKARDWRRG